jgi:hypothetical protein
MSEPVSRSQRQMGPLDLLLAATAKRRVARRYLRRTCARVHSEERATNGRHGCAERWQDCWDCACTALLEARSILDMPKYPPRATICRCPEYDGGRT